MKKISTLIKKLVLGYCMSSALLITACETKSNTMPSEFTSLSAIDSDIIQNPRYTSAENFLGRPVPGYHSKEIYCTRQTALALKKVNAALHEQGYRLVVYDAYRPQRAVNAFIAWSKDSKDDSERAKYYPTLPKNQLFPLGYIREHSGHSRGSTVDLTIIPLSQSLKPITEIPRTLTNGETILFLDDNTTDMGTSFDLLHPASHPGSALITREQAQKRKLLSNTMFMYGFEGVDEEWWHYTLKNEPYPETYFDFIAGSN